MDKRRNWLARAGALLLAASLLAPVISPAPDAVAQGLASGADDEIVNAFERDDDIATIAAQKKRRYRSSEEDGVVTASSHTWTAEEMAAAEPWPLLTMPGSPTPISGAEVEAAGEPVSIPARLPNGRPVAEVNAGGVLPASDSDDLVLRPAAVPVAPSNYQRLPFRAMGKVFFRFQGRVGVCSAASIGNNAVWTAGHCLHAGNNSPSGWRTDVIFVPAYINGTAPLGAWQVRNLIVDSDWYRTGSPDGQRPGRGARWDYGGGIAVPKNGVRLSQVAGALGFVVNSSLSTRWSAFGWPAGRPFNGETLWACVSNVVGRITQFGNPAPISILCNMTGGSSGGPWLTPAARVGGVNSFGNNRTMSSPYFDRFALDFRNCLVLRNGNNCG